MIVPIINYLYYELNNQEKSILIPLQDLFKAKTAPESFKSGARSSKKNDYLSAGAGVSDAGFVGAGVSDAAGVAGAAGDSTFGVSGVVGAAAFCEAQPIKSANTTTSAKSFFIELPP